MDELRNRVIDYFYSLMKYFKDNPDTEYTEVFEYYIYMCKTCSDEYFELYAMDNNLKELFG